MSWDHIEKVRELVMSTKMSARPEFYSGREAMLCDLNGHQLEMIYQGIVKEFGQEAGNSYIAMVDDIEVLTATRFLNSLYALCRNKWVWTADMMGSDISMDGEGSALGTLLSVMGRSGFDETPQIKHGFLRSHGVRPKETASANGKVFYRW